MALKKSKDGYGKVNAENISGKKVPRKSGYNETPFSKTPTNSKPSLPTTGSGLQGALSAGAKPMRSSRGGRGPTLPPVG